MLKILIALAIVLGAAPAIAQDYRDGYRTFCPAGYHLNRDNYCVRDKPSIVLRFGPFGHRYGHERFDHRGDQHGDRGRGRDHR